EDNSVLTGAHDLHLSATSDNSVNTIAKAGGKAGTGVGVGGALATSLANNETRTTLGSGSDQSFGGDFSAKANHVGSTTTFADGSAGGDSAAIGVALGLNIVNDNTLSTSKRNITAAGDISFIAHAAAASSAGAKASATGAKDEGDNPDDQGVDKKIGAERKLANDKAIETGTTGTDGVSDTPKAETSEGGVSVAAAIGVNIASSTALAEIPAGRTVSSEGILTLSSSNNSDATAKANGMATGAGAANVGAAVAINLVSAKNQALVGSGAEITADWLTLEAKRTEVKDDTTDVVGAEAISGASGGKVGIAGSLALNLSDSKNEAIIGKNSTVTLDGGDIKLVAEGATSATVLATAKGSAVSSDEKVVATGDTALITADTLIGAAAGQVSLTPVGVNQDDLKFTLHDGNSLLVSLDGATKLQDVITKINNATGN
ncbi:MAG: hypothetical protein GY942_05895, partial [Aestuariibacter sp.]|nr:hypothetical protein [Aestuariibacter sp.]